MPSFPDWTVIGLPQPEGVLTRGDHTIVFFDVEGLPSPDQLTLMDKCAPGWSLLCWGAWDDDTDIDDVDEGFFDHWGDSLNELETTTAQQAFAQFRLPDTGVVTVEDVAAPPVRWVDDVEMITHGIPGQLVAVNTSAERAVSVCEWHGAVNAGTLAELTRVLERWHQVWGLTVMGFGNMEEADLVACIPDPPKDLASVVNTLRLGCDDVGLFHDPGYGLLIHLWWD